MTETIMNKLLKVLVGLLTTLPLAWIALIFLALFAVPTETFLSDEPSPGRSFTEATIFYGVPIAVVVVLGVTAYFLVILFKSQAPDSKKVLWTLLLIFWFPFAGPVFWYQHVWRKPTLNP